MRVLLLSGLGPYCKNEDCLRGTLLDPNATPDVRRLYYRTEDGIFGLEDLYFSGGTVRYPILRPRKKTAIPHLTSFTLESILQNAGIQYEIFPLESIWADDRQPQHDAQIILLSTTFICERHTLKRAITWISEHFPAAKIVVGGQYSNLKFTRILQDHPQVDFIIRGDGEMALARIIKAIAHDQDFDSVPNLVSRGPDADGLATSDISYIDLEQYPSPSFEGSCPVVPYESMRGCPFRCGFCSFPFASLQWRYKSADKIFRDWQYYVASHGTSHISALDSTFTVPPSRLRELLRLLPAVGVTWEAYTRANVLCEGRTIEELALARCKTLSIGFESMSDKTLLYMNKKVTAGQNLRAFELLQQGRVGYRCSFMVGYPGENGDDYEATHNFLVRDYTGHFMLSVFSLVDETMPVWENSRRFNLQVSNADDPDSAWSHSGMDISTARYLQKRTLDEVRLRNDDAVPISWHGNYEIPLLPHLNWRQNLQIEKLIDRLIMLPIDYSLDDSRPILHSLLRELRIRGVEIISGKEPG